MNDEVLDDVEHYKKYANMYFKAYECAKDLQSQQKRDIEFLLKQNEQLRTRVQELEVQLYGSR